MSQRGAAIVTGANGSIGKTIVERFLQRNLFVIAADRQFSSGDKDHGPEHRTVIYDARFQESAVDVVNAVPAGVDIECLVVAAGIYPSRSIREMDEANWQECLDVNLTSVFRIVQASLPRLRSDCSIVLLGSVAGLRGSRDHAHYAASKAALLGFMRSVMWELAPGQRINTVSPGIIRNAMTDSLRASSGAAILQNTPMGRFGEPEEVANVIDFLCGPNSTFVQGENISVNGGLYVN